MTSPAEVACSRHSTVRARDPFLNGAFEPIHQVADPDLDLCSLRLPKYRDSLRSLTARLGPQARHEKVRILFDVVRRAVLFGYRIVRSQRQTWTRPRPHLAMVAGLLRLRENQPQARSPAPSGSRPRPLRRRTRIRLA